MFVIWLLSQTTLPVENGRLFVLDTYDISVNFVSNLEKMWNTSKSVDATVSHRVRKK